MLQRKQRWDRKRRYLFREGVCSSLEDLLEAFESRRTGLSVGNSYARMLVDLLCEETLNSFAKCTKEWVLVDRSRVYDEDTRMMVLKSGFISAAFCRTLKTSDLGVNKSRISRTEGCGWHEQRVYASREFAAERKMLNFIVVLRGEGDEEEEILVAMVLSFCRYFVRRYTKGMEPALLQYTKGVPPFDAVDEAMGYVCLRWATVDGGENDNAVDTSVRKSDYKVAGEWFGAIPSQSTLSTVSVVWENIAERPFGTEVPWIRHLTYIDRFFRASGMRRTRMQGEK